MSKSVNRRGLHSHTGASTLNREKFWKHGKSSGDGKFQERKQKKLMKRKVQDG